MRYSFIIESIPLLYRCPWLVWSSIVIQQNWFLSTDQWRLFLFKFFMHFFNFDVELLGCNCFSRFLVIVIICSGHRSTNFNFKFNFFLNYHFNCRCVVTAKLVERCERCKCLISVFRLLVDVNAFKRKMHKDTRHREIFKWFGGWSSSRLIARKISKIASVHSWTSLLLSKSFTLRLSLVWITRADIGSFQ